VFDNRELRRTFRPKGEEVTGNWRKLYNEDLHSLHSSPLIATVTRSTKLKSAQRSGLVGELRIPYRSLIRKREGKKPLRKTKLRS
jgi:hypothetical protein